jgi:16S rRNA A1518/A1519 N6-dimethyltransferase RsmA/KsgA/DIM1 with predicted DNA glycosylase/AP lyase activity
MLKNNLTSLAIDQSLIMEVFAKLNFDPQVRAERLGLAQFALLADELRAIKQSTKNNFVLSI